MTITCACRLVCASRILLRNEGLTRRTYHAINTNLRPNNAPAGLKNVKITSVPIRNFSIRKFFKWFRKPTQSQLFVKDNIPDSYRLIYRSTMERYLFATQVAVMICTIVGITSIVFVSDLTNQIPFQNTLYDYKPRTNDNEMIVYFTVFVALTFLMQLLLARLPMRMYSNESKNKEYVMVFFGNIPFTTRKLTCKIGEVIPLPPKDHSLIPWKNSSYVYRTKTDRRSLIIMEECFRRPADLYIMIGIQRDPDADEKNE